MYFFWPLVCLTSLKLFAKANHQSFSATFQFLLRSYIDQRSVDHGKESSDHDHVSTISTSLCAVESILKGTSVFSPSRR